MKTFILLTIMSIAAGTAVAQDLSVCASKGYTLNSTAAAPAIGATSYTWYEDDEPLPDSNSASYTIPAGKAVGTYAYVRVAANADCPTGVPSNTFTVRVDALPTVTASAVASACAGTEVTFTAAAGGGTTAAMTYTWTIAGATASTTTATYRRTLSTTGSNAYSVTVRNSNGCVSAASTAKTITINGPAGRDQAVGACGCASNLTACNGYCRNLAADEAVCWKNMEIKQICVDDDNLQNCPGWGFTLAVFSIADTQTLLALFKSIYGINDHVFFTGEITSNASCRWACGTNIGCTCYAPGTAKLGWLGSR